MTVFRNGFSKDIAPTLQDWGSPLKISTTDQDLLFRMVNRYFYRPVEIITSHHEVLQITDLNEELRTAYEIKNEEINLRL